MLFVVFLACFGFSAAQGSFGDAVRLFAIDQGNSFLNDADPNEEFFVRLVPLKGGGIGLRPPKNFPGANFPFPDLTELATDAEAKPIELGPSPQIFTSRPIVLPPLLTDTALPRVFMTTTLAPETTPTLGPQTRITTTRATFAPTLAPPTAGPAPPAPQPTGSISTSFSQSNGGRVCQNGRCFDLPPGGGPFRVWSTSAGCVSVCPGNCEGYVDSSEPNCPICKCNGYGVREPCGGSNAACPANSDGCVDMQCRYPEPVGPVLQNCGLTKECPATDSCRNAFCRAKLAGEAEHIPNRDCVFDFECPSQYQCQTLTCIKTGVEHTESQCIFPGQCPSGFRCEISKLTCFRG